MKILLTGAGGQLGQALLDAKPEAVELISTTRQELNLADAEACRAAVQQLQPDWVLNAGAYTAVDKAESEPELAHAVNAGAPGGDPAHELGDRARRQELRPHHASPSSRAGSTGRCG